jgi:hypothetical protein
MCHNLYRYVKGGVPAVSDYANFADTEVGFSPLLGVRVVTWFIRFIRLC